MNNLGKRPSAELEIVNEKIGENGLSPSVGIGKILDLNNINDKNIKLKEQ